MSSFYAKKLKRELNCRWLTHNIFSIYLLVFELTLNLVGSSADLIDNRAVKVLHLIGQCLQFSFGSQRLNRSTYWNNELLKTMKWVTIIDWYAFQVTKKTSYGKMDPLFILLCRLKIISVVSRRSLIPTWIQGNQCQSVQPRSVGGDQPSTISRPEEVVGGGEGGKGAP